MASSSSGNFRPNLSTIHKNDILPTKPPTANIEATIDASSLVSGPLGRRVSLVCKTRKFDGAHTIVNPNESPNTFATTRRMESIFELAISPSILDAHCAHTTERCQKLSSNLDLSHFNCVCSLFPMHESLDSSLHRVQECR